MHPNRAFAWTDRDAMLAFVAETAFCTIFVGGHVVHVPVVVQNEGSLRFHLAKANRAAAAMDGARALLSCTGPDAYISPDWYRVADQVPTWNYVAVEIEGRLRRLDETDLVAQMDALGVAHEARLLPKAPWTRAKMNPARFAAMVAAIAGYELEIAEMRGTRKLGQNKTAEAREGVLAALAAAGCTDMAGLMRAETET